ncbi:hypothetical protein BJY24_002793 [Nocardia transvalensis]|uniref:IstB-like ATP-binding domain-containing protein n=1 Tax=Nocardia transvalensis TaxID=37333 RepID=A0A7W9PDI7_9NOCA|nr:hypothetical protein [Nocardia transvalensis]
MATKTSTNDARNAGPEIAYLARTLNAPTLTCAVDRLVERSRNENCCHEEFLAACLQREVPAREARGGEGRIRAARFPSRKSLEEFDFDHQRSLRRDANTHLGTLDFVTARENVVFLGPVRNRQDAPVDQVVHPRLPDRTSGRVHDRSGMDRAAGRGSLDRTCRKSRLSWAGSHCS